MTSSFDADRALTPSGAKPVSRLGSSSFDHGEEGLRAVLEPFAAMGRLLERRALFSGTLIGDEQIVCSSQGEAGLGVLTMGHFRDAAALLPKAPGWGGMYRSPIDRTTQSTGEQP